MHKQMIAALPLLFAAATANAEAWEFTYTGAYLEGSGWDADWTMQGRFAGHDNNGDRLLDISELEAFIVGGRDWTKCGDTEWSSCGVNSFSLRPGGNLEFNVRSDWRDPEGFLGGTQFYSSTSGEYVDRYTPASSEGYHYRITLDTQFSISPLPEPATWVMLTAGLLLVGFSLGKTPKATRSQ